MAWAKRKTITFRLRDQEHNKLVKIQDYLKTLNTMPWNKHGRSLSDALRHLILFYKIPASVKRKTISQPKRD